MFTQIFVLRNCLNCGHNIARIILHYFDFMFFLFNEFFGRNIKRNLQRSFQIAEVAKRNSNICFILKKTGFVRYRLLGTVSLFQIVELNS